MVTINLYSAHFPTFMSSIYLVAIYGTTQFKLDKYMRETPVHSTFPCEFGASYMKSRIAQVLHLCEEASTNEQ